MARVRGAGETAIAVASSGIAASLLEGGTTAHCRFKIPLHLHDTGNTCGISKRTEAAEELRRCKLIVWDEVSMMNRRALEAVDSTLRDIRENQNLFGGCLTVLSGDWRQILPVVKKGGKAQIIDACFKSSQLWSSATVFDLHTNMRAHLYGDAEAGAFADFLLRVGAGQLDILRHLGEDTVEVPNSVRSPARSLAELTARIYPNVEERYRDDQWLQERVILTVLNADAAKVNDMLTSRLPTEERLYTSVDSMADTDAVPIATEVLNCLEVSGIASHLLRLKVGVPVILMRNIDAPRIVNGTLCTVKRLFPNVLELNILTGPARNETMFLPRIPMDVAADSGLGFAFRRLQFPVKVAFGLTINRCQGQTKKRVGVYLPTPVFTHGQLYVLLSVRDTEEGDT